MDTPADSSEFRPPDRDRHSQASRNAVARRKLENLREEKALHRVIANVWDEPERALTLAVL